MLSYLLGLIMYWYIRGKELYIKSYLREKEKGNMKRLEEYWNRPLKLNNNLPKVKRVS